MRRLWPVILALILLLPGFPPLLKAGLQSLAERAGYRLEAAKVSGYALLGVRLEDVRLTGPGVRFSAKKLRVDYQLLGLLSKKLFLKLAVAGAEGELDPAVIAEGKAGGGGGIQPVLTGLVLEDVRVLVKAYKPWSLPELRLWISGEGPYAFTARLPEGEVRGEFDLEPGFALRFKAPVTAFATWYPDLLGGEITGRVWLAEDGLRGEGEVKDGKVRVVGFLVEGISGDYRLFPDRLEADLRGEGLEGPVTATAEVNWKKERYRFQVHAEPTWRAVAAHYGARIPFEGRGTLELYGEGWEKLQMAGRFSGTPRLFGYALPTQGELSYEEVFKLSARTEGRFYDRDLALDFALSGEDWTLRYRDEKKSHLVLRGKGPRAEGGGELALPEPLKGRAQLKAQIEGNRWQTRVTSENVALLGFKPFSLSGALSGEGEWVQGRLGPVTLKGRWSDLALKLDPLPMQVGTLSGELRYKERFFGRLDYTSPYVSFPIQVEGEGSRWRFFAPYGEGRYADGVFTLKVASLPIRFGETIVVSGDAVYREGGWRGAFQAQSPHLEATAELEGRGARIEGAFLGPYGPLRFSGRYDEGGLDLAGEGFAFGYREGALYYAGTLAYGPVKLAGELRYRGRFEGALTLRAPELAARLFAKDGALWLKSEGLLSLSGRAWPKPWLEGRFSGYRRGGVSIPALPVRVEGKRVYLGDGVFDLKARRFSLSLPFSLYSVEGTLTGQGSFDAGRIRLDFPSLGAEIVGTGPWRALDLRGRWPKAGLAILGKVDLFRLSYRARLTREGVSGAVYLSGQGANYRVAGELQSGGVLRLLGDARGISAEARGFRLDPFGVPAELTGRFGYDRAPWAELRARYGDYTLIAEGRGRIALRLRGPYLAGEGTFFENRLSFALDLQHPYAEGRLRLEAGAGGVRGEGAGELRLPGFLPASERFSLSGKRWRLTGPISAEGEGLAYRGEVHLVSRVGPLTGRFAGEGKRARFEGRLALPKGEAKIQAALEDAGPRLLVRAPGGELRYQGGVLEAGRFDLGALLAAFGVPAEGEVTGALGQGRLLKGRLSLYGQEARFAFREGGGLLWLSGLDAGARLRIDNEGVTLRGIGALQGTLGFKKDGWQGELRLLRPVSARLLLKGPAARPDWRLFAKGTAFELRLSGEGPRYQGRFVLASPYAEGELHLAGEGLRYRGEGTLSSTAYLLQSGPVELSGEGARLNAVWKAPLSVTYQEGTLIAKGRAPLAGGGTLAGELSYRREAGFLGAMALAWGAVKGELRGEGPLSLSLTYPGGEARARVAPDLALSGEGGYQKALLKSELRLAYRLGGRLFAPELEGEGALRGEGARVALRFGYRGTPWLRAEGEGLSLRAEGRFLEVSAEGLDLAPYLGLPLTFTAEGAGTLDEIQIPLRLEGPKTALSGVLDTAAKRLVLSGRLYGAEAQLAASPDAARLSLNGEAPEVRGTLSWQRGAGFGGELFFRQPLYGGALKARLVGEDLRLLVAGEGAVSGSLAVALADRLAEGELRYRVGGLGEVWLRGEGSQVLIKGAKGLSPLAGRLDLKTPSFTWRYQGPLPGGFAELRAEGRLPGRWLGGELRVLDRRIRLLGEGGELRAEGEGLRFSLASGALSLSLSGFLLGPVRLSGEVSGEPRAFSGRLSWEAYGRKGEATLQYQKTLDLRLVGDLAGRVSLGLEGWRGALSGPELSLTLKPRYQAEGTLLDLPLWLDLEAKEARWGGLTVRYPWAFSGTAKVRGVRLKGAGDHVVAEAAGLLLEAWPRPLRLRLLAEDAEGALTYQGGRVSGTLALSRYGVRLLLRGEGETVRIRGRTPALYGLPVPEGRLWGELGLSGDWEVGLRAGEFFLAGKGRGLKGTLRLESPYGGGQIALGQGFRGTLSLKGIPVFDQPLDLTLAGSRLVARLESPAGTVEGYAQFAGYRLAEAGAEAYALDLAALPWVKERLPYLVGRVGAVWRFDGREGILQVGSAGIGTEEERYPLALTLRHDGEVSGELVWAGLRADFRYQKGSYRVTGEAANFPLDLPVRLVVGPIEGGVRFTGRFAGGGPALWLEVAGERVRIFSPGQEMVGQVALAYREGRLELRRFAFGGDGRMRGEGVWTFGKGGDLWLVIENADFSPLLLLDPRLARWRPEGRGDLEVRAQGERLSARGRGRFELASVAGEVEAMALSYDAARDRLSLSLSGQVVRPVESRLELSGEGGLKDFQLKATGDLRAPLLGPLERVEAELSYPELTLKARAGEAVLTGRLWPLDLTLKGPLPIAYPRYYLTSGEAALDLRLRLMEDGLYHLSGEAQVVRALIALPEERPQVVAGEKKEIPLAFDQVHIFAEGGVLLNNPLAQGEAAGDLYLGGTAADPYLVGRAWALWGNFLLLNHRFEVEEAWARFSPELGVYPELYLRARAETPEGPLYLIAEGRFVKEGERAELVLDTCVAEREVKRLATCKLLPQEGAAARLLGLGEGQLAEQVLDAAVKNLLIGQLESELAKSLGLDLFRFETGAFEGEGLESTRFTVGKYLSPEFFLAYRYDFSKGSRIYASYRRGGLSVTFATDLSPDPNPEFSLGYAFTPSLSAYLRLEEDRFELGLEWRP